MSLGSLALALLVGEVAARLAGYGPHPSFLRLESHPDLQLVPLPNQEKVVGWDAPERGMEATPIRINNHGQRGADYPLAKQPGERRIIGLGDSLTFGKGVQDGETYLARLEELLDGEGVRVVNAAFNGYATFHYRQWALTQLETFQPDLLIVGLFTGNDMEPVGEFASGPLVDLMRGSALRHLLVDTYRRFLWKRVVALKRGTSVAEVERELERSAGTRARGLSREERQRLWSASIDDLRQIREVADAHGVPTVCLLIPTSWMVAAEDPEGYRWLRERVEEVGMPVIDPRPELHRMVVEGNADPWLAHDRGHLSPAGHRAVAAVLAERL